MRGFLRIPFGALWALIVLIVAGAIAFGQDAVSTDSVELPETPHRTWGKPGPVWVIRIYGTIDDGLAAYVRRAVDEAERADAGLILLEIDTFGGLVSSATEIRDVVLRTPVPVAVYIPNRAVSAGALIALTGERIVMEAGSNIGAAEPIPNDAKSVAYVRGEFEATAERMGRDPEIAAAMVDQRLIVERVIDGRAVRLVDEGQILSLSANDAMAIGFIDHVAEGRGHALELLGYGDREVVEAELSSSERFLRFITDPTVAQLLLSLGFLALLAELSSPGVGFPGAVGVIALGLFFGGRYVAGILEGWQVLLFIAGVALLLAEIFVIPGFGVAGVLGLVALGVSIWYSFPDPASAVPALAFTAVAVLAGLILLYRSLDRLARWKHIILKTDMGDEAYAPIPVAERQALLGKTGVTTTVLRPAGIIEIDGEPYDAVSEGAYIPKGETVRVVKVEGTRIVVRQVKEDEGTPRDA